MPVGVMTVRIGNKAKTVQLPAILLGQTQDNKLIFQTFWTKVAHFLLNEISKSFRAKSKGGADRFGNTWKPLSPSTILSRAGGRRTSSRGLLTLSQNRLWGGIFASTVKRKMKNMSLDEAKKEAAKLAWGILKARGAKLRSEVVKSQNILMLVVTGKLRDSLTPSPFTVPYAKKTDQIFEIKSDSIRFGTAVPYASKVSKDRPVIPEQLIELIDLAIDAGLRAIRPLLRDLNSGQTPNSL